MSDPFRCKCFACWDGPGMVTPARFTGKKYRRGVSREPPTDSKALVKEALQGLRDEEARRRR